MKSTIVALGMLAIGAALLASSTVFAKTGKAPHAPHTGTFVSATAGKLVMTGTDQKEHSHTMAKDCKVTVAGKTGTLTELKKGTRISVTTDKSGHVTAIATPPAVETKPVTKTVSAKPATTAPAPAAPATAPKPAASK
jgi:hypothetical protein